MFGCNNDRLFPEKYTMKDHISKTKLEKGDRYYIQRRHKVFFPLQCYSKKTLRKNVSKSSLPFSSFSFSSLFTYKQIGWIKSAIVCFQNYFFETVYWKLSTTITNPYALNTWKQVSKVNKFLDATLLAMTFLAQFPAKKNAGQTNASHDLQHAPPPTG